MNSFAHQAAVGPRPAKRYNPLPTIPTLERAAANPDVSRLPYQGAVGRASDATTKPYNALPCSTSRKIGRKVHAEY